MRSDSRSIAFVPSKLFEILSNSINGRAAGSAQGANNVRPCPRFAAGFSFVAVKQSDPAVVARTLAIEKESLNA
jgi:hypothetical protein